MKIDFSKIKTEGILYVLLIQIEGKDLVKIGVTSRGIADRVLEITESVWIKYRYFPYVYPKRFRKTDGYLGKEKVLHKYFKEYKYKTEFKFGGSTECFSAPLDKVVAAYEYLLEHGNLDNYKESIDD